MCLILIYKLTGSVNTSYVIICFNIVLDSFTVDCYKNINITVLHSSINYMYNSNKILIMVLTWELCYLYVEVRGDHLWYSGELVTMVMYSNQQ